MPTIVHQLEELVKLGAQGDSELPGTQACQIILKEGYLGVVGWPEKPKELPYATPAPAAPKQYAPRPNDKGHKMAAKLTGMCTSCTGPINVGDMIYYKKGQGANHVECIDAPTATDESNNQV